MKKIKKEYYLLTLLMILFILLTFFVMVEKTNLIDEMFFNSIIKLKNNVLTKTLYVITNIGSTIGVALLLVVTAIIFIRKKAFSDFKYVFFNVVLGVFLMQGLKYVIKRIRPSWKWIVQGGFSYPSGHTISAILLYGTLILLVSKKVKRKFKVPLIVGFSLMIFLISISRIYFGAHYLTDVIASLILGTIILIISNMFMNKEFSDDKNKDRKTI